MNATTVRSRGRCRGDRGDVMLMTTIVIIFLMLGAWALISAGQQWGARRDIQATAAAAARAGAEISTTELRSTGTLDLATVTVRAQNVLHASGCTGSVAVNATTVMVTATRRVHYSFPAPAFPATVTAAASANAVAGVRGDEGG